MKHSFLYYEDIDWCYRASLDGWKNWICIEAFGHSWLQALVHFASSVKQLPRDVLEPFSDQIAEHSIGALVARY
jgi:hypothetical protein